MVAFIFCNYSESINYEDLPASKKCNNAGSEIAFFRPSYRITFFGLALLNAISSQMFQNKKKMSPPVLPVSLAEHLQILKIVCFFCNNKRIAVVTLIYNESVLDGAKLIVLRNI